MIIHALRLTPFVLFPQPIKLGVIPENLINHISHVLAMVIAFPNVLLMCENSFLAILFCQKLSILSNAKLISCIFQIIAATDCYIIFIICTTHVDLS